MTSAARSVFCPACGRHVLRAERAVGVAQRCKGCGCELAINILDSYTQVTAVIHENAGLVAKV